MRKFRIRQYLWLLLIAAATLVPGLKSVFVSEVRADQIPASYILENDKLKAEFDGQGRLVFLASDGKNIIDAPVDDFFFANLIKDNTFENLVWGHRQTVETEQNGNTLYFRVTGLVTDTGRDEKTVPISIEFRVSLEKDSLVFSADIDNKSDYTVLDFEYPRFGAVKNMGAGVPSLFWPEPFGAIYTNVGKRLSQSISRENGANQMKITYPGYGIMGWEALMDRENTLALSVLDHDFYSCSMKAQGDYDNPGAVTLSCIKYLCAEKGISAAPPIKVTYKQADWHVCIREYAYWMKAHRPSHAVPQWAKDMQGLFLVINKQQFGYEMWNYSTIPQLWQLAKAHGCDTLALFGWYDTGHDNNYPDLKVSKSMGGEKVLKSAIREVQADGGRVLLYHQGHLIDRGSPYYKSGIGKKVSCKTIWNDEYGEYYSKSHKSTGLQTFSNKLFSIACPFTPQWRELMAEKLHQLADLGADGVLFDQIGGMPPYLCFDKKHGHNPALALTGGQRQMLQLMENQARTRGSEFAFFSENITDLYSSYLDAVHGIYYVPEPRGARMHKIGDEEMSVIKVPEVFRYAFPETVITVRNAFPYINRRLANFAFVYGAPLELEVRYEDDKKDILADKYPEDREYAYMISSFRKTYYEYLKGTFIDTDGITNTDYNLYAKGYRNGKRITVCLWNDSEEAVIPDISVSGKNLKLFVTPDGEYDRIVEMGADSPAFAVFE